MFSSTLFFRNCDLIKLLIHFLYEYDVFDKVALTNTDVIKLWWSTFYFGSLILRYKTLKNNSFFILLKYLLLQYFLGQAIFSYLASTLMAHFAGLAIKRGTTLYNVYTYLIAIIRHTYLFDQHFSWLSSNYFEYFFP